MNIPPAHQTLMPYLILNNAEEFISFTQKVFGAKEISKRMRDDADKVMHAEIMIGGNTIMLAEASEQWGTANANIFIYVPDADETYKKALAEGAISLMELSTQGYGRTCGITDPFGNVWWITTFLK